METKTKVKVKEIKEIEENDEVEEAKLQLKQEIKDDLKKEKLSIKIESDKKIWKEISKKIGGFKEETTLEINKDNIHIREVDDTNVVMADLTIKKKAFDEYKVNLNSKVGINIKKLNTHLSIFDNDITVVNYQNQLVFTGESGKISKMGLISVVDFELKLPTMEFAVECKTPAEPIKKMIEVATNFSQDMLKLLVKDKKLYILVADETDEVRFPICAVTTLEEYDGDFETLYSTDYLKTIMNFENSDTLIIRFGKNLPMEVLYSDVNIAVKYLLAPRIESE